MSVFVCLSVCVPVHMCMFVRDHTSELYVGSSPFFVHVTYGRGWVLWAVIRYVLPVLWMTSYLVISQAEAQCTRSLGLGNKRCAVIPVAGQRTYGTTFRALKTRWKHRWRSLRSMTALFVMQNSFRIRVWYSRGTYN